MGPVGLVDLELDCRGPIDEGVTPLLADPALVLQVLPGGVHLPLATAGDLGFMA